MPRPVLQQNFLENLKPQHTKSKKPQNNSINKYKTNTKMGPPRRKVLATAEETLTPPDDLSASQQIARVIKATGNNIYAVELPSKESMLVELPARFRSTIWIKRGSFVLVDTNAMQDRENKLRGEIVNVVRDEKRWRKEKYWYVMLSSFLLVINQLWEQLLMWFRPKEFVKRPAAASLGDDEDEDEEESRVGKIPSSDESDA